VRQFEVEVNFAASFHLSAIFMPIFVGAEKDV
jgi:hypothetical protein